MLSLFIFMFWLDPESSWLCWHNSCNGRKLCFVLIRAKRNQDNHHRDFTLTIIYSLEYSIISTPKPFSGQMNYLAHWVLSSSSSLFLWQWVVAPVQNFATNLNPTEEDCYCVPQKTFPVCCFLCYQESTRLKFQKKLILS